ncbi:MAG: serine/threonine protein kinase [Candidatus Wallbacteria bacterium]|nr:serine/threonine protein kinase [Candidatus Wallbacteria bacterium]
MVLTKDSVLGDYRIEEFLGQGGAGSVYRATQIELGRRVALKVFRADSDLGPDGRARFCREAQALARLSHPGIVPIYDFGSQDDLLYYSMELAPGLSLDRQLRTTGPLDAVTALRAIRQVLDALEAVHAVGVLHRDIKPANVLRRQTGDVLLSDFGLARDTNTTRLTRDGSLLGTLPYFPPEIVLVPETDERGDLYQVGVMLFELLMGQTPYGTEELHRFLQGERLEPGSPLAQLRKRHGPAIAELVSRGMEPDREKRFQSAVEMRRALDAVGAALPRGGELSTGALPAPTQSSRWSLRLLWPVLAAGVGLALAFAWLALQQGPQDAARAEPVRSPVRAVPAAVASLPAVPHLKGISTSQTAARLWFDAPAPRSLRLAWRPAGSGSTYGRDVPEGKTAWTLAGLQPSTEYRAELEAGGQSLGCHFRTLDRSAPGTAVLRDRAGGMTGLEVACRGDRVAVAWRENLEPKGATLRYRQSLDGCETWDEAEVLEARAETCSWPSVAWGAGGAVVAWACAPGDGTVLNRVLVRAGNGAWSPPLQRPGRLHEAGLDVAGDGPAGVLLWEPAGTGEDLRWFRLSGPGPSLSDPSPPLEDQHSDRGSRCCRLFRVGERLLLLGFRPRSPLPGHEILIRNSTRPEAGEWSRPRVLLPADAAPSSGITAALVPSLIAICYEMERSDSEEVRLGVRVQRSADGGRTFDEPKDPLPPKRSGILPAIASSGDTFYLACIDYGAGEISEMTQRLVVLRSPDAVRWSVVNRQPLRAFDIPRDLALAVCDGRPTVFINYRLGGLQAIRI